MQREMFHLKMKVSQIFVRLFKKEDTQIGGLANFHMSSKQCILCTDRVLSSIQTLIGHVICLKRLTSALFGSSELFHMLRLIACQWHPYIESTVQQSGNVHTYLYSFPNSLTV